MGDIYQNINGADYRRIFVVGDIHGCLDMLNEKLLSVDFDESKDLLISVGDLIDRGEQNVECLDLITYPWFRAVRGNHEQMAIDALHWPAKNTHTGWQTAVFGTSNSILTKNYWPPV